MSTVTIGSNIDISSLARTPLVSTTWTRSGTVMTIVWPSGKPQPTTYAYVSSISDASTLAIGTYSVANPTSTTTTVTCNNAGATSGTITITGVDWVTAPTLGATLSIDCHTVYGESGNIASIITGYNGNININSTLVRLVAYTGGAGTVPASGTVISKGGASGKLVNVYSALNAAPTLAGQAIPASGYVMVRQWNSVSYSAGALTGITATASGPDTVGWLEVRMIAQTGTGTSGIATTSISQATTIQGDWWDFLGATTTGASSGTYQIPTNGYVFYCPGVEVETSPGSGVYEFYGTTGGRTAISTNYGLDIRNKFCWISTDGLVRFGSDGTNSGGGWVPLAGCKLRVPNVFITAVRITNLVTTGVPDTSVCPTWWLGNGGTISIDKAVSCLTGAISGVSVSVTNTYQFNTSSFALQNASTVYNFNVAANFAHNTVALSLASVFSSTDFNKCTFVQSQSSAQYTVTGLTVSGVSFTDSKFLSASFRANQSGGAMSFQNSSSLTFTRCTLNGVASFSAGSKIKFKDTVYFDRLVGSTNTTNPVSVWSFAGLFNDVTLDGLTFLVAQNAPYTGLWATNDAMTGFKVRNIGTLADPLNCGGPEMDVTWTRSTTVATVTTSAAHNMSVNDTIFWRFNNSSGAFTNTTAYLVTAVTALTFTFTCNNGGNASGIGTFYQAITSGLGGFGGDSDKAQRIHTSHTRAPLFHLVSSSNAMLGLRNSQFESISGDPFMAASGSQILLGKNSKFHKLVGDQTVVSNNFWGAYWSDYILALTVPPNTVNVAWTRSGTTATLTSAGHNLWSNMQVLVTSTSDAAAIINGMKTITTVDKDTVTFTCLNAGATSGTLNFTPYNSRIANHAAVATAETAAYSTLEGGAYCAGRTITLPSTAAIWTVTSPDMLLGFSKFLIAEISIATNTLLATYSTDGGITWHNLSRPIVCAGTVGQYTITVPSGSTVEVGDYVFGGVGTGYNAKVTAINGLTLTMDTPNVGSFSGQTVRFNHAPSEVISATSGFNLKIKYQPFSGSLNIQNVYIPMYSDAAALLVEYPLDQVTLTLSANVSLTGAEVRIYDMDLTDGSLGTELSGIESNTADTYAYKGVTDNVVWIQIMKSGYQEYGQQVTIPSADTTLYPILLQDLSQ